MSKMHPKSVPIVGFEGLYSISPIGRVFSHIRNKIRKDRPNRKGYPVIALRKDGRDHWFTTHSLVAKHFIGPRPEGYTINHKDGNKLNRSASNLEYITLSDNIKHAFRIGVRKVDLSHMARMSAGNIGRKPPNRSFKPRQIRAIRRAYAKGNISMWRLCIQYKTSTAQIHRIVHRATYKDVR